jgi:hypothetical protein
MKLDFFQILAVASVVVATGSSARAEGAMGSASSKKTSGIEALRLNVGEAFLPARARIITLGWKPIRMHSDDNYEYTGAEKHLAERKFLEVDSCSIDAGANCILYYSKAGKCLRLDTVGEQVAEMTVTRWTNECPRVKP